MDIQMPFNTFTDRNVKQLMALRYTKTVLFPGQAPRS